MKQGRRECQRAERTTRTPGAGQHPRSGPQIPLDLTHVIGDRRGEVANETGLFQPVQNECSSGLSGVSGHAASAIACNVLSKTSAFLGSVNFTPLIYRRMEIEGTPPSTETSNQAVNKPSEDDISPTCQTLVRHGFFLLFQPSSLPIC